MRHYVVSALLSLLLAGLVAAACGGGDDTGESVDPIATPATPSASPQAPTTAPTTAPQPEPTAEPGVPTTEPTATPRPTAALEPAAVVAAADGLGVVSFGDEAAAAVARLTAALGPPDVDTGWQDPTDPANEPLWPGCPGREARLLQWTDRIGVIFTDWDGDLSQPVGTVAAPYFAGYGLWRNSPIRTTDGATAGGTLGELQAIYGDRVTISTEPDMAVDLYWFTIDGTTSPMAKTGGLRGWLFPPEDTTDGAPEASWTAAGFTAGVSCDTP